MEGSDALMAMEDREAGINMVAVYIRNEHARLVVAGFAAELASLQARPGLSGGDRHGA
jgi:hypothetical protein